MLNEANTKANTLNFIFKVLIWKYRKYSVVLLYHIRTPPHLPDREILKLFYSERYVFSGFRSQDVGKIRKSAYPLNFADELDLLFS